MLFQGQLMSALFDDFLNCNVCNVRIDGFNCT